MYDKLITLFFNHNSFLRCEQLFNKQEYLENYNSSLKILMAQFGENPDKTLLPNTSNLLEDIKNEFDKI